MPGIDTFITNLRNSLIDGPMEEETQSVDLTYLITDTVQLYEPLSENPLTSHALLVAAHLAPALSHQSLDQLNLRHKQLDNTYLRTLTHENELFNYHTIHPYLVKQQLIAPHRLQGMEAPQFIRQSIEHTKVRMKELCQRLVTYAKEEEQPTWKREFLISGVHKLLRGMLNLFDNTDAVKEVSELLLTEPTDKIWFETIISKIDELRYPEGPILTKQQFLLNLLQQPQLFLFRTRSDTYNPSILFGSIRDVKDTLFYVLYDGKTGRLIYTHSQQKIVNTLLYKVGTKHFTSQVIALKTSEDCVRTTVPFQPMQDEVATDTHSVRRQCQAFELMWKKPLPKRNYSLPRLIAQYTLVLLGLMAMVALFALVVCDLSHLIGFSAGLAKVLNIHPWQFFSLSSPLSYYAAAGSIAMVDVFLLTVSALTSYTLIKEAYHFLCVSWFYPKESKVYQGNHKVPYPESINTIEKSHWVSNLFQNIKKLIENKSKASGWYLGEWGSAAKIYLNGDVHAIPSSMIEIYHTICKAEANNDYSTCHLAEVNRTAKKMIGYENGFKWFGAYRQCSVETLSELSRIEHLTQPMTLPSEHTVLS